MWIPLTETVEHWDHIQECQSSTSYDSLLPQLTQLGKPETITRHLQEMVMMPPTLLRGKKDMVGK